MAEVDKEITVKVRAEDDTQKATQSAKARLRDLQKQMLDLETAGQKNTDQFRRLAAEAGSLKDAIGDTSAQVKVLASDTRTLDTFTSAIQGIAGGFAVAQGAAALFGEENEDLQEAMMKVQAALALVNGATALANTLNKDSALMVNLNAVAQRVLSSSIMTTVASLGAFRAALIATGVGAAVVAIGALIMHMNSLADAEEEAKIATDNYNKSLEQQKNLTDKVNANLDLRRQLFLAQGGDAVVQAERDIVRANEDLGKALARVGHEEMRRRQLLKAGYKETDREIVELDLRLQAATNNELQARLKIAEANNVIKDAYEAAEKASKKTTKSNKKNNEEEVKAFQQHVQDVNALIFETERNRLLANERELEEIDASYEAKFALVKGDETATALLLSQLRAERIAKIQEQQDAADQAQLDAQRAQLDYQIQIEDELYAEREKKRQEDLQRDKAYNEARVQFYNTASGSIVEIMRSLGGKSKAVMLAALALEKGMAIAQVVINLQKELAGINANAALNPANALTAGAAGVTQALSLSTMAKINAGLRIAAIAATSIGQVSSITGGGGGGGGGGTAVTGGGGGGMAAPQGNALNPNSQLINPNTGQPQGQSMRAYVVESDVRTVSGRLRRISEFAQLAN